MLIKRLQSGYMDNQLPPVIVGVILIVGMVSYSSKDAGADSIPAAVVYLVVALGLAAIALGIYLNIDSLNYPESPFNKHTSPWLIAVVMAGGLGHAAWSARGGAYAELSYLLAGAIAVALLALGLSISRRNKV